MRHLRFGILATCLLFQAVSLKNAICQATERIAENQDEFGVTFFNAKQVDTQIHKVPEVAPGTSLVDLVEYSTAKGGASILRRTKPGRAEVHKRLIDTWYVIRGGGFLVTGGELSMPIQTEPEELRGPGITGGKERHIAPGDFVRIPAGVPHWVRTVEGQELIYLVVKTPK